MINNEILSETDSDLFYELWLPLLDYVNRKSDINKTIGKISTKGCYDPNDLMPMVKELWNHSDSLISSYLLDKCDGICLEHRNIIDSWRHHITSRFILERHLKKGSIFIDTKNTDNVYLVKGLKSSLEEMVWMFPLPVYLDATLIPFKNTIVSDGLVVPYNIHFGSGVTKEFNSLYMKAKKADKIIKSL